MAGQTSELKVFITVQESACDECGEELGRQAWITLEAGKGALCLACADLDHLLFLPAGDAALTRRASHHSTLVAVVLKWSRARKRYERQGLLVEQAALERAEEECLEDAEFRARRREREATRRARLDQAFVASFAEAVLVQFPGCPPGREAIIAEHACLKYSGRVGRSAAARQLDEQAVRMAVSAHIRHAETAYERLLAQGYDRWDARAQVAADVERVLARWEQPAAKGEAHGTE
jgi:hypothetical protein